MQKSREKERLQRIIEDQKTEIGILTEKVKVLTLENIRLMNKESRKHLLRPDPPSYSPHPSPLPNGEGEFPEDADA